MSESGCTDQTNAWRPRVSTLTRRICLGLLAAALWQPVFAQPADAGGATDAKRMQGGGINYAPQPAVYSVVLVDTKGGTLRLRAADGRTGLVYVAESVYDLSKLKAGDKIRVDFVAPDSTSSKLTAASIWPEK
jgi:hypothetical protein